MKFAKQKLLIFLCFGAMLPVASLALLETPELSTWVLNLSLRFARLRTGLKIDAQSWDVNPVTMSAQIENVRVVHEDLSVSAPRVQIWISPVALLVGRMHLSDLELRNAKVVLDRPNFLTESPFKEKKENTKEKESENDFLKTGNLASNLPRKLGALSEDVFERLKARNIGFDDVHIENLSLEMGALRVGQLDFSLNNLLGGQLRVEWNVKQFGVKNGIAPLEEFKGTLSLLATDSTHYQLYVGEASLRVVKGKRELLRMRGAWPGELAVDLSGDVAVLNEWIKKSPWLEANKLIDPTHGTFELLGNVRVNATHVEGGQFRLNTDDLNFEGSHLNRIRSDFSVDFKSGFSYQIKNVEVTLPVVKGVRAEWNNRFKLESLKLDEKKMSAKLQLDEASLCGILKAAAEKECQVGVAFTGPLTIEGKLNPLDLKVDLELKVSEGPVMSDPYIVEGTEPIVQLKPSVLKGKVSAFGKHLTVDSLKLLWDQTHEIAVTGDVIYVPTKVDLRLVAREAKLEEMLNDLVGLRFGGPFNIESNIFYDHALPRVERTRIVAQLRSSDFSFEGQQFGSLSGPLKYENRILRLGPFQLRSGGGSAVVQGSLTPNPDRGPYLGLNVNLNRFEFAAFTDEAQTSEAFRGFVTGKAALNGFVDRTRSTENGLIGEIAVRARNFKAFKIPFNEADLTATYKNLDLIVSDLVARKDGGTLKLKGLLSPKGGSELVFSSDSIPLRNIDIEPKLALFEKGLVTIDGYWRPNQGWGVDGKITDAVIAGAKLGKGTAVLRGTEDTFSLSLQLEKWMKLDYRGVYKKDLLFIDLLEADLKDQGIYAGLAYLGDWTEDQPVLTRGNLAFQWRPESGYFKTRDLRISAPHLDEGRREDVLDVPGSQQIEWKDSKLDKGFLKWMGPSTLETEGNLGDSTLGLKADLPLGLVRLFLPDIDIRRGRASLEARMPLSPNFATMRAEGLISNGLLRIPGIASEFSNLSLAFDLQRSQLGLQDGRMNSGAGWVTVRGVYRLDFDKPAADLSINLERARLVLLDDVPAVVDGSLQLRGESAPYLISGKVIVTEALYAKEFETSAVDMSGASLEEAALKFDMDVEISDNTKVHNSIVESQVRGRITLKGDSLVPLINGDLELPGGSIYANNVEFKIIQGQVQFFGDKEGIPIVNLRANTTVRYSATDYKIEMNARGPGTSLSIEFSSEPALSNQDIVSLLAFGVIRQDEEFSEGNDDLVSAAQAEAFQAIFGRAIGNSLSKSTGFDVRLKASSASGPGKSENVPKVSVMRRLSDRVTARFARSLDISNPEKDLQVDYRLLNNVNLSGVWESPTPEETSVGVDLRFRFEVE